MPPDFATDIAAAPAIGFVHRKLPNADVYFIANAANRAVSTTASLRLHGVQAEWWNPFSGEREPALAQASGERTTVPMTLAPYESKILILSASNRPQEPTHIRKPAATTDFSTDWKVTFLGTGQTTTMAHLHSWTDDEATRYYSGRARYEKTIDLSSSLFNNRSKFTLDFGPGIAAEPGLQETPGMHALLDGPVREAAVVLVNGKRAGLVWHPPYEVDVTGAVQPGSNHFEITVGNLAINELAGHAPDTYTLLNLRYGERFQPQDMNNLRPLPSGILRPITLRVE